MADAMGGQEDVSFSAANGQWRNLCSRCGCARFILALWAGYWAQEASCLVVILLPFYPKPLYWLRGAALLC
eukprot:2348336-Pyramimonas_sp.AAC.1